MILDLLVHAGDASEALSLQFAVLLHSFKRKRLSLSPDRRVCPLVSCIMENGQGVTSVGPSSVEKMGGYASLFCFTHYYYTHVRRQRRQRNTVKPPFLPKSVCVLVTPVAPMNDGWHL